MRTHRYLSIALAACTFAVASLATQTATAQEVGPFLGTYHTKGKQGWRNVEADIEISKAADGTLTVSRTAHFTSRRYRRKPAFSYESHDVTLVGNELKVTYRLTVEGVSVHLAAGGGLVTALEDPTSAPVDSSGNPVDVDDLNILTATYKLQDNGTVLREAIRNQRKKAPEDYWRNCKTKGKKLTTTDPDADSGRLKLGDTEKVTNGDYTIVIPTDGTLTVELSGGTMKLKDPDGNEVEVKIDGEVLTYEIGHKDPVLGAYTLTITGAGADEAAEVKFIQDGRIDARIRPWSSHTYYPIYKFSGNTSTEENGKTLFREDGPLHKLDKALELEGDEAARVWEMGGDYRTGFGFEDGHYVRLSRPSEKHAEKDWHADLDRDGVLEIESADETFKTYDTNGDDKVDEAEAKEQLIKGQIKVLWKNYDKNSDGKVTADEIFATFITKYDSDGDSGVSEEEWDKALRKDYTDLLDDRIAAGLKAFMEQDSDGDGFVVKDDLEAPGSVDFQDSSDVDNDKNSFFDRDNIRITDKDGKEYYGNKVEESGDKLKLFKGRKRDEFVVELDTDKIEKREDGIADGDIDDSYSVGWWGHCNAWALGAIVFRKPTEEFEVNGVTFTIRDQKGILCERGMWDSEESTFWWKGGGGDDIDPTWYAAGFHRQLHRWLRVEQQGMMADMDMKDPNNQLNFQVWNYPLLGYVAEIKEAEGGDPHVVDLSVKIEKGSYGDEDGSSFSTVTYTLQFNADGSIDSSEGGKTEWTQGGDTKKFIRYLIHPFRFTRRGSSGNPIVTQETLEKLFGDHLKYNRIADIEAEDAANGGGLPGTGPGQ